MTRLRQIFILFRNVGIGTSEPDSLLDLSNGYQLDQSLPMILMEMIIII